MDYLLLVIMSKRTIRILVKALGKLRADRRCVPSSFAQQWLQDSKTLDEICAVNQYRGWHFCFPKTKRPRVRLVLMGGQRTAKSGMSVSLAKP